MTMLGKKHSEETKRKIGKANSVALLGKSLSDETKAKIGAASKRNGNRPPALKGRANPSWKEKVLYGSLHDWVRRNRGTPKECEHCKVNDPDRMYHWANKSRKYKRELTDWIRLCVPCHHKYDN